ncbi:MAG: hypothetical protein IPP71_18635 [Bacteroidetes bacterium]|nr:hypothetical protein [Bacteroidota bacterium]
MLKNSTFNGTTTITRNGSSGNYHCEGNNIFSGPLSLDNAASAGRIRMASTNPDTYLDNVTLSSSGGMDLQIAYSGENFSMGT